MTRESTALGDAVTKRREALGLDRRTLAEISGIGEKTLYNIESGGTRNPQKGTWLPLERSLGWAPGALRQLMSGNWPIEHIPFDSLQAKANAIKWPGNTQETYDLLVQEYMAFVDRHYTDTPTNGAHSEQLTLFAHVPNEVIEVMKNGIIIDHLVGRNATRRESNLTIVTLLVKLNPNEPLETEDVELATRFTHLKDRAREAEFVE